MPRGNTTPRNAPKRVIFTLRLAEERHEELVSLMEAAGERSRNRYLEGLIQQEFVRKFGEGEKDG